jgi:disulfide bond formation protein DsbB
MTRGFAIALNALGLYGIALVLATAFAAQLLLGELPCPLCLMQRIQFAMLAAGPILNVRFGPRPSHYALALLAAIAGAIFAARQILLHIAPGDAGYGSALLGYHYYTWAFIGFAVAIALTAIALLFERQFAQADLGKPPAASFLARAAVWLVIALVALNVVSTLMECGFAACPDNPVSYQLLKSTR